MFALVGGIALVAASGPQPRLVAIPPKGSLAGVISYDDYPKEALDRNEQGEVAFTLNLDATGAVTDCIITKSSGFASLDTRTCEIVRERAKFEPARDRRGLGVAVTYSSKVKWQIGEDWTPSEPWAWRLITTVSPDLKPVSCAYEFEGAMAPAQGAAPPTCSLEKEGIVGSSWKSLPLPKGKLTKLVSEMRFEIGPGSADTPLRPGDVLLQRAELDLKIDALGKLQACTVITLTTLHEGFDPCTTVHKDYHPRNGPGGKPAAFNATMTFTDFAHVEQAKTR